jgi:hypothetical protein
MDAHIVWSLLPQPGLEHLHLVDGETEVLADGLVLGIADPALFRLSYQVRAAGDWTVRECQLQVGDTSGQLLRLSSDGQGHWTDADGNPYPALDGCRDVDISVTPFTNTLPIRRLALTPGESQELLVAYITVPDLGVRPVRQRYTCLSRTASGGLYRYEGLESGFRADLSVDAHGLVIEYPDIWKRVWIS